MIEVWVTAKLTDEQFGLLEAIAHERYPDAIKAGWPDYTQVPNLLRDLMAEALRPLLGEEAEWEGHWAAGPLNASGHGI